MRWFKKGIIILLSVGILLTGTVTAINLYRYFSTKEEPAQTALFHTPDFLEIRLGNKTVILTKTDPAFDKIIVSNRQRGAHLSYYYQAEDTLSYGVDTDVLVLTYGYNKPIQLSIPLRLEDAKMAAQNISFLLTGDYGDAFVINEQPSVFYTALNIDAELIQYAEDLLEERGIPIEEKNSFFPTPTKIILKNIHKSVSILSGEEVFQSLLKSNNRRLIASFYPEVEPYKTYVADENYNGLRMYYCYEEPVSFSIPSAEGPKTVQADRILFILTAEESDKFILEKNGSFNCYTGIAEGSELLQLGFKTLNETES